MEPISAVSMDWSVDLLFRGIRPAVPEQMRMSVGPQFAVGELPYVVSAAAASEERLTPSRRPRKLTCVLRAGWRPARGRGSKNPNLAQRHLARGVHSPAVMRRAAISRLRRCLCRGGFWMCGCCDNHA